mgnify:CR=1 FL=1
MKIIIVGAGEVGFHIASHLALENKDVVVLDKDPDAIRRVSDNLDVQIVIGSGSLSFEMIRALVERARAAIASALPEGRAAA